MHSPWFTDDFSLSLPPVMILKSLGVESIHNRTARALGNLAIDVENLQAIHDAGEWGRAPPLANLHMEDGGRLGTGILAPYWGAPRILLAEV